MSLVRFIYFLLALFENDEALILQMRIFSALCPTHFMHAKNQVMILRYTTR